FFFFQAEDGIRYRNVTGVQTCALPIVIPKVIFTVVSSCIAAYGFGRFDFPGRKIMFSVMLATLFLPQVVLNVPQFLLYNSFGWINSPFYLAIWVHRSEEHTSELQSRFDLVCRLLLEKKNQPNPTLQH